jgi:hypothetical protein
VLFNKTHNGKGNVRKSLKAFFEVISIQTCVWNTHFARKEFRSRVVSYVSTPP